ncbi:MAG: YdbH domain-containing protein [Desulfatibacillaceae bacterium]
MTAGRVVRVALVVLLCLTLAASLAALAAVYHTPGAAREMLVRTVRDMPGLSSFEGEVQSVGLTGATLGPFTLGDADEPALAVASVRVSYSPLGIVNKNIPKIVLSGVVARIHIIDGAVVLPGLDLSEFSAGDAAAAGEKPGGPPVSIHEVAVENGLLLLEREGVSLAVPFSAKATPKQGFDRLAASLALMPWQGEVLVDADVDLVAMEAEIDFSADGLSLGAFAGAAGWSPGCAAGDLSAKGRASLALAPFAVRDYDARLDVADLLVNTPKAAVACPGEGCTARVSGNGGLHTVSAANVVLDAPVPARVEQARATVALGDIGPVVRGDATFAFVPGRITGGVGVSESVRYTASCAVTPQEGGGWQYALSARPEAGANTAVALDGPAWSVRAQGPELDVSGTWSGKGGPVSFAVAMQGVNADADGAGLLADAVGISGGGGLTPVQGGIAFGGEVELSSGSPRAVMSNGGVASASSANIAAEVTIRAAGGRLTLAADARGGVDTPGFSMDAGAGRAGGKGAEVTAAVQYAARGDGAEYTVDAKGVVDRVSFALADTTGSVGKLRFAAKGELVPGAGDPGSLSLDLAGYGVDARTGEIRFAARAASLRGRAFPGDGSPRFTGALAVEKGRADAPDAEITGIELSMPVAWPPPERGRVGTLRVAGIFAGGRGLGSASAEVRQTRAGAAFSGKHENDLLSGLRVGFAGEATLPGGSPTLVEAGFTAEPYDPAGGFPMENLLPDMPGMLAGGELGLEGEARLTVCGVEAEAMARLENGWIDYADMGLSVRGLSTRMRLPLLPKIVSAPAQPLSFSAVTLGKFVFSDGSARYRVEGPDSLLIEEARTNWGGGVVHVSATRVRPGVRRLDLVFYCDRVRIDEVLGQLGGMTAEGSGTVSGRVPIEIREDGIDFGDAFLYSAPGDGGKLNVTGADVLTRAIPEGTPQHAQLQLAQAALEDYDYEWVRVSLDTEGDQLLVSLNMDGKPAKTLPFIPSREFGGFMKVRTEGQGSNFQGIQFDINLRFPLEDMLQYGKGVQTIMEFME